MSGSNKPAAAVPQPSAGASRSLQFDQPPPTNNPVQPSAFASYIQSKPIREPHISQKQGNVEVPAVHQPTKVAKSSYVSKVKYM